MDGDFKTATEDQFYSELINRFFNPQGYFFHCITNYLNRPLLITKNPEPSILKFLAEFFEFLTKTKQSAQDLKEITRVKGFEYVYSNLTNQIIRYDLRSLEKSQLKKAIQHIALSLLKDFYHILITNEKSRETLALYIDIKSNLRDLLNGSNGKHSNKNSIHSLENSDVQEHSGSFEINPSFNEPKPSSARSAPELKTASIFSGFRSQNNKNLPNNDNDILIPGEEDDEELLKLIQEIDSYKESLPLNNFAETQEVKKNNFPTSPPLEDIAPENHKESDDDSEADEVAIGKDEDFEDDGEADEVANEKDEDFEDDGEADEVANEKDEDFEDDGEADQVANEKDEDFEDDGEADQVANEKDEDFEDDSEADEVAIEKDEDFEDDGEADEVADEKDEDFEDDDDNEIIFDESTNKIFQQEAVLYYKILSNAVLQLKNDEKIQSALEDIELASSSLKHLAQKFGMEKLALLPELIESVSMLSNNHIIKPPASITQGIEDGINLLKKFDVNNNEHRTKFMSILTMLKEYYMKTLHTTEQIPVTFQ